MFSGCKGGTRNQIGNPGILLKGRSCARQSNFFSTPEGEGARLQGKLCSTSLPVCKPKLVSETRRVLLQETPPPSVSLAWRTGTSNRHSRWRAVRLGVCLVWLPASSSAASVSLPCVASPCFNLRESLRFHCLWGSLLCCNWSRTAQEVGAGGWSSGS